MNDGIEKRNAVKNGISRLIFSMLVFLLEAFFIINSFLSLNEYVIWIDRATRVFAVLLVLVIYAMNKTSSMKTPWIILILVFPILGVGLYLIIGMDVNTKKMRKRYEDINQRLIPVLKEDVGEIKTADVENSLEKYDSHLYRVSQYVKQKSGYPVYQNTDISYYSDALEALEAQKEALRNARKYIFMEYHAIEDSQSWQELEVILAERAKAGVEVRVFYDDAGSIVFINMDFVKKMEALGIKCRVFNPFIPGLNVFLNNRDHRKITVVDGKVGFTGGYNLADEYFNRTHPYGMWKDTGIRLTGDAVKSLTVTFLENWNAVKRESSLDKDIKKYIAKETYVSRENGFIQPYADSPLDDEHVGEEVYIGMINQATKYCWFITPYLIITDEMIHAMGLAAKQGVDVRVITPGIPDKKIVYSVTRSYYNSLARNGVRIYEWTPGFCHCKMCITDDKAATCGTINLDYRSLYHHFENGCLYIDCDAVMDTKKDFENIMSQCREVTEQYTTGRSSGMRLGQLVLRLFAPLL